MCFPGPADISIAQEDLSPATHAESDGTWLPFFHIVVFSWFKNYRFDFHPGTRKSLLFPLRAPQGNLLTPSHFQN
jgi:hypothetical protein